MDKFQSKYRIPSSRMQNWDYSWNAAYFVTICTDQRICFFGEIINGDMQLSEIGELANKFFAEIPEHFPNVHLNAYVVMPNHIHGIIIIDKPYYGKGNESIDNHNTVQHNVVKTPNLGVSTIITAETSVNQSAAIIANDIKIITANESVNESTNVTTNQSATPAITHQTITRDEHKWKSGTLGVIINQYKRICTINARKTNPGFGWHPRFHDRVIQDNEAYIRIRNYIVDNPKNWDIDKFHK
jgi:putative transposase